MEKFIKENDIRGNGILDKTIGFFVRVYRQSSKVFSYASGVGGILLPVMNMFKINMYYLQDVALEGNLKTARRNQSVYGLAELMGHNVMRGRGAVGTIRLSRKNTNENLVINDTVIIPNYVRVKCENNGLSYIVELSNEMVIVQASNPGDIDYKIIEGELQTQVFTGTGESNQTFEVSVPNNSYIDDEFVKVFVNGIEYDKYVSTLDIPYRKNGVRIRTGITSGVDIQFGNSEVHTVPSLGESIRVDYLLVNGSFGNMVTNTNIVMKFLDSGFTITGESIDLNDIFNIFCSNKPDFGADSESVSSTRSLASGVSRNYIIHDARTLKYFLERMNYFSVVKVYNIFENYTNNLLAMVVPKIYNRYLAGEDYFSVDLDRLTILDSEKTRILNMLDESGNMSANLSVDIQSPKIRKFGMILVVEAFRRYKSQVVTKDMVKNEIRNVLSAHMTENKRLNKLPNSDIVRIVDNIDIVDTVKVVFVSPDGMGIDSYGNISVEEKEMIVVRGPFTDVDGVSYADGVSEQMSAVTINITFVDAILS